MEINSVGEPVDSMWLWISLPRATFAVHLKDGVVDDASSMGRWAIGCEGLEVIEKVLSIKNSVIIRMKNDAEERKN